MQIEIDVVKKIAQVKNKSSFIVCGNKDYIAKFNFDNEWETYPVKTARFIWANFYIDVEFEGNECQMPVINNTLYLSIGVYAGDLHTTTPALIDAKKSILCNDPVHVDPPEDVYNQLLERLGHIEGVDAVRYTPQTLTEEQKQQARNNIDVAPKIGTNIFYGVSETAAETSPKVVTTTTGDFKPVIGARLGVYFKHGNIVSNYLVVDNNEQIRMVAAHYADGTIDVDTPVTYRPNGQVIYMTFDGEYFILDNTKRATAQTVGLVTISDSVTSTSTTTAASSKAVKAVNDRITTEIGNIEEALGALL